MELRPSSLVNNEKRIAQFRSPLRDVCGSRMVHELVGVLSRRQLRTPTFARLARFDHMMP
jgi:hypothetical protein